MSHKLAFGTYSAALSFDNYTMGILQVLSIVIALIAALLTAIGVYIAYKQSKLDEINRVWDSTVRGAKKSTILNFFSRKRRTSVMLKKVIIDHMCYCKEVFNAGTHDPVHLQFYVDLMEAAVVPEELNVMAQAMVDFIKDKIKYSFDIVAVPKNGSPLLGYKVSKLLNKKLLLVRDFGCKQSYKFDGEFEDNERAILIDDVSSDGTFLTKPIILLKEHGVIVHDCLVLVHRKEGDAYNKLKTMDFKLHSIFELSDEDCAKLIGLKTI